MWRDAKELWEEERGMGEGKGKAARWGDTGSLSLALGSQPLCHCLAASELSGGGVSLKPIPTMATAPSTGSASPPPGRHPQPGPSPGAVVPTCGSPRARAAGRVWRDQHPCGATGSCSRRHGYGFTSAAGSGWPSPPPPPRQPHTDTRTSSTDGHTAVHPGLVHRHGWAHTGMLTGTDKHRPTHACNTCMTVHTHTHPPPPPQMWTDTDTPHAHNCAPACVPSNTPLDMFLRPRNYTVSLHPISAPSYPHHIPAPPSLPTISAPPYPHCIPKSALQPCTLIPAPLSLRPCIYTASLHPISVLSYPHHIPAPPSLHPHTYIASLHPQIFTVSLHPHPRTPTSTALSQPPPSLLTRPR